MAHVAHGLASAGYNLDALFNQLKAFAHAFLAKLAESRMATAKNRIAVLRPDIKFD